VYNYLALAYPGLYYFACFSPLPTNPKKFIDANDIKSGGYYPIVLSENVSRTLEVFTYQKNNDLCVAASQASGANTRRKRAVTISPEEQALAPQVLDAVLTDQV